jgi:dihydroorotate dehydrogenase
MISAVGIYQLKNPYSYFHQISISFLNRIDPEISHKLVEVASFLNLLPQNNFQDERLKITLENEKLNFPNPIGLAAGFDKNGKLYFNLHKMGKLFQFKLFLGFGFIEIGSICPKEQPGNPKPRIFKYPELKAIINRCGFNSEGIERVKKRLQKRSKNENMILGINLGKNKTSPEADPDDFVIGIKELGSYSDYITINIRYFIKNLMFQFTKYTKFEEITKF